jgi:hypothetical protein
MDNSKICTAGSGRGTAEVFDFHKVKNQLGIIRMSCEGFTIDVKDGLYAEASPDLMREDALKVMQAVIRKVDDITECLNRVEPRKRGVPHG